MCEPNLTGDGTVTTLGTTTTFTDAAATYSRTTDNGATANVIGAPIRFILPWGDEWESDRLVTGIAGQVITYAPATPVAVPQGTAYVIGGIQGYFKTPILDMGDPSRMKTLKRTLLEYQPPGFKRNIHYAVDYDRKGFRWGERTWSESDREFTDDAEKGVIYIGGTLAQGRMGVAKLGMPGEACTHAQILVGFDGIDNPLIAEALSIELLE
jgi:hypothetical protein